MDEYTAEQISVMQKFLNVYKSCPEVITRSDRFVSPNLNADEIRNLEALAKKGLFEIKESPRPGVVPTFYRLSDHSFGILNQLEKEGKLTFS